jgi:hypothetical protein
MSRVTLVTQDKYQQTCVHINIILIHSFFLLLLLFFLLLLL